MWRSHEKRQHLDISRYKMTAAILTVSEEDQFVDCFRYFEWCHLRKRVYFTFGIYPFSICIFYLKKYQLYLEYFTEEGAHVSVIDFTQDGGQNGFTMCIPFDFATYLLLYTQAKWRSLSIYNIFTLHFSANLN